MKKHAGDKYGLLAGAGILVAVAVFFLPRTGDGPRPSEVRQPEVKAVPVDPTVPLVGRPADDSLIHAVLTPSGPVDHAQLLHRIEALPDTLTEAETHAICRALREGLSDYSSLAPEQKHHLANQLMDAVLRQKNASARLAGELAEIWQSPKADETLRDYALQHLAQLIEGRGPASPHLSAWQTAGLPILLDAARNVHLRSSGTALLALHFLSDPSSPTAVQVPELNGLIEGTAVDQAAHLAARAAAFQAAAARNGQSLLAEARRLARDRSVNSGLRLSVIHYLGACGEATDRALLTAIAEENDRRYLTASRSARTRLLSRLP